MLAKDSGGTLLVRSRNGDITLGEGAIFGAEGNLVLEAKGNLKNNGQSLNAVHGDLTLKANTGAIENKGILRAGKDIVLTAQNEISQKAAAEALNNIYISNSIGDITLADNITAINGSVAIMGAQDIKTDKLERTIKAGMDAVINAKRDVSVGIVTAKKQAQLSAMEGNLHAEEVRGEDVYLSTDNEGKEIRVNRTYVANNLGLKGNNAYLYDEISADSPYGIWQTGDGTVLNVKLDTAAERPWNNLILNFKQVNDVLKMDDLWVNDLLLHVPTDKLYIERLQTTGKADIATDNMHSIVYGKAPSPEQVDSVYWNAPQTCMRLYFYGDGRQYSDGVLLHLRDYRYVYNQRYAADDWLLYRTLKDDMFYRGDIGLIPLWERYNLLDYPEPLAQDDVKLVVE